jgi:hypothetical protein
MVTEQLGGCQIKIISLTFLTAHITAEIFTFVPCILILSKFFYSPTDAQVHCLKNNFKIYIKIYTKTALTCLDAVTSSSGSALLMVAKVTVVKIAN